LLSPPQGTTKIRLPCKLQCDIDLFIHLLNEQLVICPNFIDIVVIFYYKYHPTGTFLAKQENLLQKGKNVPQNKFCYENQDMRSENNCFINAGK
jgi:hypothetical protein